MRCTDTLNGLRLTKHTSKLKFAFQYLIQNTQNTFSYRLVFCKHKVLNNECVEHEFETFKFFNWHHICLTYEHQINDNGSKMVSMDLYVDGTLVQKGKIHTIKSNLILRKSL